MTVSVTPIIYRMGMQIHDIEAIVVVLVHALTNDPYRQC